MFPLFQTIFTMTENSTETLNHEERLNLSNEIKELDKTAQEYVYLIIRTYQLQHDKDLFENHPYHMKINKNGIKFEMGKLPSRLVLIIKYFVDLHKKSLHESCRTNFFDKK
jgi:hypothetical protein